MSYAASNGQLVLYWKLLLCIIPQSASCHKSLPCGGRSAAPGIALWDGDSACVIEARDDHTNTWDVLKKKTTLLTQQGAAWPCRFPSAPGLRQAVFWIFGCCQLAWSGAGLKEWGWLRFFFGLPKSLAGCFAFQRYDGKTLKLLAVFTCRMKGYTVIYRKMLPW